MYRPGWPSEAEGAAETQTGKIFRLRGKGVTQVRGSGVGDLLCKVIVETPVKLTDEQRDLLQELKTP